MADSGIVFRQSCPYTSAQNGRAVKKTSALSRNWIDLASSGQDASPVLVGSISYSLLSY